MNATTELQQKVSDYSYQLGQLSNAAVASLAPSFARLPLDPYIDGDFRLRRYSNFKFIDGKLLRQPTKSFMQSSDINQYLGDVERVYAELEESVAQSEAMVELFDSFKAATGLGDDAIIEVHQMRITCQRDDSSLPAPEGVHQDGFDFLGVYVMGNHDIEGGDIMLYNKPDEAPFFQEYFEAGRFVILNDRRYFHNAAPIAPLPGHDKGAWDVIVLTAHAA
ncbi:2OG-Fe dioxygenase family protein [Gallaecimonas sp. GXIMD4217]|uniref:2OG-Fe dioxygenase family protein n=1 Tax=Gallaecimonas sp. GXIMD4217 TaxID=3131927 RepID=UPI00311B2D76